MAHALQTPFNKFKEAARDSGRRRWSERLKQRLENS